VSGTEGPDRETDRLRRLDALAELLPMLGSSLDIREIFGRLSAVTTQVLPHDAMAVVLIADDREHVHLHAVSADVDFARPDVLPVPAHERDRLLNEPWDFIILDDVQGDPRWRDLPPARAGYRSSLRVPIRAHGDLVGGVNFMSRAPSAFTESDVPVARRVADYITVVLSHQRLADEAQRAAAARERAAQLERRVKVLTDELEALSGSARRIVGVSGAWQHVLHEATRVAPTETTVLLTGESGTGKEIVARFVHHASPRAHGPFVALNCAALPDQLLESELFGFERGAFTGASSAKPGRLETAAGGVLFLDEVAEMSGAVQAKLLRVLQEREFQRLGGTRTLKVDVRLLAATNRDLRRMVARGEFREDLYYRLHVFEIHLPPLRERPDDVLPLCRAFLAEIGQALGRPPAGISREATPVLMAYHWPGNARELRNVLERASILADGGLITREHLAGLEPQGQPGDEGRAARAAVTAPAAHGNAVGPDVGRGPRRRCRRPTFACWNGRSWSRRFARRVTTRPPPRAASGSRGRSCMCG
jgi:transcriptional regulator with GAF, ATPase, and Fis domain